VFLDCPLFFFSKFRVINIAMQTTLKTPIVFTGWGLHTGRLAQLTICPAMADQGFWFCRTDISVGNNLVQARWDAVQPSSLCTTLANKDGVTVSTVEHLLAALVGCGVHNALIEIDGPEVPILDGSALAFVRGLVRCGLRVLSVPVHALEVLKPVSIMSGNSTATLVPFDCLRIDFQINFDDSAIGSQYKSLRLVNSSFARELCDSRTFCCKGDIDRMQANGKALGGSPGDNAVVFDGALVASPGGLRHPDEPLRHKMLDAVGDLALAGVPLIGHYTGVRAGHSLTNRLLNKLFTTSGATRMITCDRRITERLPGFGLVWEEIPVVV